MRPSKQYVEEEMMKLLSEFSPLSSVQVAELTGIERSVIQQRFIKLHSAGLVHVSMYYRRTGKNQPAYAIGKHKDAEHLEPLPESLIEANYRHRMRTVRKDEYHARIRQRYLSKKRKEGKATAIEDYRERQLKMNLEALKTLGDCPIPRPAVYRNIFTDSKHERP